MTRPYRIVVAISDPDLLHRFSEQCQLAGLKVEDGVKDYRRLLRSIKAHVPEAVVLHRSLNGLHMEQHLAALAATAPVLLLGDEPEEEVVNLARREGLPYAVLRQPFPAIWKALEAAVERLKPAPLPPPREGVMGTILRPGAAHRRVGHYQLQELRGGNMGYVYLAWDAQKGRRVALKLVPQDRPNRTELTHRLMREGRALERISNPHVIERLGEGQEGDIGYLVLEYIPGENLAERMKRGVPVDEAVRIAGGVARGMASVHEAGVLHRDLKPSNVMISPNGVKVIDFGTAYISETPAENEPTVLLLTAKDVVVGTVEYMSPEQLLRRKLDGRADLFSLGVILYEMLARRHPFRKGDRDGTIDAILTQDLPAIGGIPEHIDAIVRRALEKDPSARWASMAEFRDALESASQLRAAR